MWCIESGRNRGSEATLTLAVSFPIPAVPPVTRTTLPVMSGTSSALNLARPGKMFSLMMAHKLPMLDRLHKLEGMCSGWEFYLEIELYIVCFLVGQACRKFGCSHGTDGVGIRGPP